MANHKSAIKRHRQILKRNERNKSAKSAVRTAIKKAEAAAATGNKAEAQAAARKAESMMAKAVKKALFHKATLARKVSRVQARVNKSA